MKVEAFRIATELPRFTEIIKCAAEAAKRPLPWTELSLLALQLLTVTPNKSYGSLYPVLFDRFDKDTDNTLLHAQFVKFVTAAIEVPELRVKILGTVQQAVLKNAQVGEWRKGAKKVGFYLELGRILDKWIEDPAPEWVSFRDNALKLWLTKDENAQLEVTAGKEDAHVGEVSSPAPSGGSFGNVQKNEGTGFGGFPAFEQPKPVEKKEESGFGGFPTFDEPAANKEKKDSGFGEFPSFEQPKPVERKEESGFGGFPTFDEPANKEKKDSGFGEFPSFDQPKPVERKEESGFGGFPTFDEPANKEKKDTGFGEFPSFDQPKPVERKEESGFGGFPTFDEPVNKEKKDSGFGEFPSFEQPKPVERKEESGFGGFPTFDEPTNKEKKDTGFGGFPSFDEPANKEKKDTGFGEFPSFEQPKPVEKKQESGFGGFPSFDETPKQPERKDEKVTPAAPKSEPIKPTPTVPTSKPATTSTGPADISFAHFMELINNPCWEYDGPSPAELFRQKQQFSSSEEALAFLINQS